MLWSKIYPRSRLCYANNSNPSAVAHADGLLLHSLPAMIWQITGALNSAEAIISSRWWHINGDGFLWTICQGRACGAHGKGFVGIGLSRWWRFASCLSICIVFGACRKVITIFHRGGWQSRRGSPVDISRREGMSPGKVCHEKRSENASSGKGVSENIRYATRMICTGMSIIFIIIRSNMDWQRRLKIGHGRRTIGLCVTVFMSTAYWMIMTGISARTLPAHRKVSMGNKLPILPLLRHLC